MALNEEFREFIYDILRYSGKLRKERARQFVTGENLSVFKSAFKHKTADPLDNYERLEFVGDSILDHVLKWYLAERMHLVRNSKPIINKAWLTNMRHYYASDKFLGELAENKGFARFVKYVESADDKIVFKKVLEDVMEAFCGAIVTIADRYLYHGTGLQICCNIVWAWLDDVEQVPMKLDYELYWDKVTQLKELYNKARWGDPEYHETKTEEGLWNIQVYGYTKGNKSKDRANEVLLAFAHDRNKAVAKQTVARSAVELLGKKYRMVWSPPDPYIL